MSGSIQRSLLLSLLLALLSGCGGGDGSAAGGTAGTAPGNPSEPTSGLLQDFELNSDWQAEGQWVIGAPAEGEPAAFSGEKMAGTNIGTGIGYIDSSSADRLISPVIVVADTGHPVLRFWTRFSLPADGQSYFRVLIDDGNEESVAVPNLRYTTAISALLDAAWAGESNDWQLVNIDLSPWIGSSISIVFEFFGAGASGDVGALVDDIHIDPFAVLPVGGRLPYAESDVAYDQLLSVSGVTSSVVWELLSGDLPEGIGFNEGTGGFAGTATGSSRNRVVVKATSDGKTATAAVRLDVKTPGIWIEGGGSDIGFFSQKVFVVHPDDPLPDSALPLYEPDFSVSGGSPLIVPADEVVIMTTAELEAQAGDGLEILGTLVIDTSLDSQVRIETGRDIVIRGTLKTLNPNASLSLSFSPTVIAEVNFDFDGRLEFCAEQTLGQASLFVSPDFDNVYWAGDLVSKCSNAFGLLVPINIDAQKMLIYAGHIKVTNESGVRLSLSAFDSFADTQIVVLTDSFRVQGGSTFLGGIIEATDNVFYFGRDVLFEHQAGLNDDGTGGDSGIFEINATQSEIWGDLVFSNGLGSLEGAPPKILFNEDGNGNADALDQAPSSLLIGGSITAQGSDALIDLHLSDITLTAGSLLSAPNGAIETRAASLVTQSRGAVVDDFDDMFEITTPTP